MFVAIKISDKQGSYYEHINVTHITRTSFVNQMNPDAGTRIHLRTGDVLLTSYPMDILTQKVEECWKEAALMIMVNIIAEKTKIDILSELELSVIKTNRDNYADESSD